MIAKARIHVSNVLAKMEGKGYPCLVISVGEDEEEEAEEEEVYT